MEDYSNVLKQFGDDPFTRQDLSEAMKREYPSFRDTQMKYLLEFLLKTRTIVRVSRNQYLFQEEGKRKDAFEKLYSERARMVIAFFLRWHADVDFRIWELDWMNEFLKEPVIKNKIFVQVRNSECDEIFGLMKEKFENLVLIKPGRVVHHRIDPEWYYNEPDYIFITPLIAEAPHGNEERYEVPLEKIIVDMFAERILAELLAGEDYALAISNMFRRYVIDEQKMFRYARRRNKEDVIREYIETNTDIVLLK